MPEHEAGAAAVVDTVQVQLLPQLPVVPAQSISVHYAANKSQVLRKPLFVCDTYGGSD